MDSKQPKTVAVGSDGLLGWEGTAARLADAKTCGVVRDGYMLATVRIADALNAARQLHEWRDEVVSVRLRNEELRNEVDGVLAENSRLRDRIAKAASILSA